MASIRPPFDPLPADHPTVLDGRPPLIADIPMPSSFVHLLSCASTFPLELFAAATAQLIHHPEYNSTLILRSETLHEYGESIIPAEVPVLSGHRALTTIHRKLLPRRPGRDGALEQYCTLYSLGASADGSSKLDDSENDACHDEDQEPTPSVLVLTPLVPEGSSLPYYHPAVNHLAFRQLPSSLRIEVLLLTPNTPTDPASRLYRTCLALLDTLHRYIWGAQINYQKRVMHDCLVPREPYQDLYLVMRERHKHLVDTWQEATDPLKHVFEDIGIATYLILLWKDMYPSQDSTIADPPDEAWRNWGRPPNGFVDLGCGNGLLTHILTSEGYAGVGFDLRARTSWETYPPQTRSQLVVHALDPVSRSAETAGHAESDPDRPSYFGEGVFLIGNHADELTPWLPLLATRHSCSGYLSIPCCAWTFDTRFNRDTTSFSPPFTPFELPDPSTLNLGGGGGETSSYARYRIWLAGLSVHCGWAFESDTLRIPSTRNWAIVGRERVGSDEEAQKHVEELIRAVHERGVFKTRRPEGKAGNH